MVLISCYLLNLYQLHSMKRGLNVVRKYGTKSAFAVCIKPPVVAANILLGTCNTLLSTYTLYRHIRYCTHLSIYHSSFHKCLISSYIGLCCLSPLSYNHNFSKPQGRSIFLQEGHDGPGVAHLSLLTKHNQFPTSCEIYVLPNNKILNSSV